MKESISNIKSRDELSKNSRDIIKISGNVWTKQKSIFVLFV